MQVYDENEHEDTKAVLKRIGPSYEEKMRMGVVTLVVGSIVLWLLSDIVLWWISTP